MKEYKQEIAYNNTFADLRNNSPIYKKAMDHLHKLANGPRSQDLTKLLEPIARESFEQKYGFKPEAGIIRDINIKTTPQKRIKIILKSRQGVEQYIIEKEVARLTKEDKQHENPKAKKISGNKYKKNQQWFELAEKMEQTEIEKTVKELEEKIDQLAWQTQDDYKHVTNMTNYIIMQLIQEDCSIKEIGIYDRSPIWMLNGDIAVQLGEFTSKENINNATKLLFPTINITAETLEGIEIAIKLKTSHFERDRPLDYDQRILIDDSLSTINKKIKETIKSKKDSQLVRGFSR